MNDGWIKLHRKIQSNELWKERREFSKAEAWIDILMEAQHSPEPQKVALGMSILYCNRGECLKSLETWADRWGWDKSKVRRFLKLLQTQSMIHYASETVTTRIKVIQYEEYQGERNASETEVKHKQNANETQMKTDNNVKKEKNVKNKELGTKVPGEKDEEKKVFGSPLIADFKLSVAEHNNNFIPVTSNTAQMSKVYWNTLQLLGVRNSVPSEELPIEVKENISNFLDWMKESIADKGFHIEDAWKLKQKAMYYKLNFLTKQDV